ncbi:hypothetical protein JY504_08320, partial [Corynebacterium amycolatum]|uniref:hypothetical protein n=1 Tax=Corynebacterium amycolatum TaxID=43765 RepID=UPI002119CFAF
ANICFWSIYFPQTRSSEHENQRFRTHILSLNPVQAVTAFMAGGGGAMEVTDYVYDRNGSKNGLKVS